MDRSKKWKSQKSAWRLDSRGESQRFKS